MFCQCFLDYVIFDLHAQKQVQIFLQVPISFLELINLGFCKGTLI